MPESVTPPPLPDALLGETPSTKLLWLYLRPQGPVSYSTRALTAALYGSQPLVHAGLGRLRTLELLTDLGEHRKRVRGAYQAVTPGGHAGSLRTAMDARDPPPLPAVLEAATPTTKIVFLYLEPYREVQVTVAQLEKRLGVSLQPAFRALRDLSKLGLVSLSPNVRGRTRGISGS